MRRVLIQVYGGVADFRCDEGVEVEVIDWDLIRDGENNWTPEQIQRLAKNFDGLVTTEELENLKSEGRGK